jgi:hypothetical protein
MEQSTTTTPETNTEDSDFKEQINAILNRTLTPENIDSYGENALNDLIAVVSDVLREYDTSVHPFRGESKQKEEAALARLGLDSDEIDATLQRISEVASDISGLDSLVESIRSGDAARPVFVPTQPGLTLQKGNGNYTAPKTIPRLKTLLFILHSNFSLNLDPDVGEVSVSPGAVKAGSLRVLPYEVVEAPSLNRMVLVCDEEGNTTFVFDTNALIEAGLNTPAVARMKKNQIHELLKTYPGIGSSQDYSDEFTPNIISLLTDISEDGQSIESDQRAGKYLRERFERAPEENRTLKGIHKDTGLDQKLLKRAMESIRDELGEVKRYLHGPRDFDSFNPLQQAMIIDEAHRLRPDMEERSANRYTINQIAARLKIASDVIRRVVKESEESSIEQRVNNRPSPTFDEAAVERIIAHPRIQKVLLTPKAPQDVETANVIGERWGVAPKTIAHAAREYHMPIGDYKVGKRDKIAAGYRPEDRAYIRTILDEKGNFAPNIADNQYSVVMAKDILKMSEPTIRKVIAILKDDPTFGPLEVRKINSYPTSVMSETQLRRVDEYMTSHNMRRETS